MNVELRAEEAVMLRELLEIRIREMHPEIRRCRDYRFRDELKDELKALEGLAEKFEVPASETAQQA